ncbi:MAG: IS4 family transposase [Amaricoccus sp.]
MCGLLLHASLAVTPDGLPLGLTAVKVWSRDKFKGTAALKRKINPTRVPIDRKESVRWLDNLRRSTELIGAPERCVHIGDRESDIYELFCLAQDLGTNFLVRTCVDRLAEDGGTTIAQVMRDAPTSGMHRIRFRDASGQEQEATLAVKFATMLVRPPIGKQKLHARQTLQVIHAEEIDPPADRRPVFWKLITNLAVATHADAVHKLGWYARRWSIETFFKTLKSGCRVEEVRLTTADRLANCIALCCVVAWRIHWMTMLRRSDPDATPAAVFTDLEIEFLDASCPEAGHAGERTLDFYMICVARLGGYLARRHDAPPGQTVIWRGFSRLADLVEGFATRKGQKPMGN